MKLVVRVQYIGERARLLLREDLATEYTNGLIDDLESFGFPLPHEQKPIEKSGFMLCVWHVDRDGEVHRAIQNAFTKAKAEAASLIDRSIRYISLNEDGVMHTTSLSNKPYKPKTYNKQDHQNNPYYKPFGKAPKYPTVISQARKAVTPLSQRIAGADTLGHTAQYLDLGMGDVDMRPDSGTRTPPVAGSDASNSVVDVAQHTLMQLSQSSAFQSLLQRGPTVTPVKVEPAQPDLSLLLNQPVDPPPQPEIPNLKALLDRAGVKSASAHALLSAQPSRSQAGTGTNLVPIGNVDIAPIPSISSSGTQLTLSSSSLATHASASTSSATAPRSSAAHAATRELWDVRRQINALQARESSLVSELQRLGQPVPPMEGGSGSSSEQRVRGLESEVGALREQLKRETQLRRVADASYRAERGRRAELEGMMKDTTRECKQPFVVPALLDAFMKIGQMTGDALKDAHSGSGTVHMEL